MEKNKYKNIISIILLFVLVIGLGITSYTGVVNAEGEEEEVTETEDKVEEEKEEPTSEEEHKVEFKTDGGSELEAVVVDNGSMLGGIPEPKKNYKLFAGWYIDGKFDDADSRFELNESTVESDLVLHAKWVDNGSGNDDFDVGSITIANNKKGETAKLAVDVKNLTRNEKEVTLIAALFDVKGEDKEIFNTHVMVSTNLDADAEETLEAEIDVPDAGEYRIRAFIWDDMENQGIITKKMLTTVTK